MKWTNYAVRIAIFRAALEAVEASLDAHGHIVEPKDAWDFIRNQWFEAERDDYSHLPDRMPIEFVKDYRRLALEGVKDAWPLKTETV